MKNYEKIMLALFAIQHNAYVIQSINDDKIAYIKDEFSLKRAEGRDKILADCLLKLRDVMEELGECVNAMDAVTGIDARLMDVPYNIVYGRKTADDYE